MLESPQVGTQQRVLRIQRQALLQFVSRSILVPHEEGHVGPELVGTDVGQHDRHGGVQQGHRLFVVAESGRGRSAVQE